MYPKYCSIPFLSYSAVFQLLGVPRFFLRRVAETAEKKEERIDWAVKVTDTLKTFPTKRARRFSNLAKKPYIRLSPSYFNYLIILFFKIERT